MRRESGFTLIELVVVIVILGILAAFAVPRFLGMQREAHISTLQGLQGSIQGAVSLVHAKVMASGNSTIPSKDIPGSLDDIHTIGSFPAANSSGIVASLQDTSGFRTNSTASWSDFGLDGKEVTDITYDDSDGYIIFYPENRDNNAPLECAVGYAVNSTDYAVSIATDDC